MQEDSAQDTVVLTEPVIPEQPEVYQDPPVQPPPPPPVGSGSGKMFVGVAALIVILLLGGGFVVLKSLNMQGNTPVSIPTPAPTSVMDNTITPNPTELPTVTVSTSDNSSLDEEAKSIDNDLKNLEKDTKDADESLNDKQIDIQ